LRQTYISIGVMQVQAQSPLCALSQCNRWLLDLYVGGFDDPSEHHVLADGAHHRYDLDRGEVSLRGFKRLVRCPHIANDLIDEGKKRAFTRREGGMVGITPLATIVASSTPLFRAQCSC